MINTTWDAVDIFLTAVAIAALIAAIGLAAALICMELWRGGGGIG